MKKLLAMLGATGLVVSTGAILVSCNEKTPKDETVVELAFIIPTEGTPEVQTVEVGKNEDSVVLVTVKAEPAPEEKAEDKVANAEFSEETGFVTVTALTEGRVTFEVTTTPKPEPEPAPETKAEAEGEGEETPAPEPVLIKTIIVNVTKEGATDPEGTPNYDKLQTTIGTAEKIKDKGSKTQEAFNTLQDAIGVAKAVEKGDEAKALAAESTLAAAIEAFNSSDDETSEGGETL